MRPCAAVRTGAWRCPESAKTSTAHQLRKTQHFLTFSHFCSQDGNIISQPTPGAEMSLLQVFARERDGGSPFPRVAVVAFLSASEPVHSGPLAAPSASAACPRGDMAASRDAAAHTSPLPLPPVSAPRLELHPSLGVTFAKLCTYCLAREKKEITHGFDHHALRRTDFCNRPLERNPFACLHLTAKFVFGRALKGVRIP